MRKYIYIFKSEIMSNLQYVFDIIMGFVGYVVMLYIFLNLWKYVYSDPSSLINGYNMNQMIWYVFITEIIWSTISGRKYTKKICNDVKTGNVAYNINKPYNYIIYCVVSHLGESFLRFIIYTFLGIILGFIFLGSFPTITLLSIIAVLITALLAVIISTLILTFIGLFSFFIEDAQPFYWVYSKIILLFGTIFPLEFFPKVLQPIIRYSPIYVVSYGPAKLFVDFSINNFLSIILAQLIYIIITYLLCALIYRKGVRKLNVNGG